MTDNNNRIIKHYDFTFGFYLATGGGIGLAELFNSSYLVGIVIQFILLPGLLLMPVALFFSLKYWRDLLFLCPGLACIITLFTGSEILYVWRAVIFSCQWFFYRNRVTRDH